MMARPVSRGLARGASRAAAAWGSRPWSWCRGGEGTWPRPGRGGGKGARAAAHLLPLQLLVMFGAKCVISLSVLAVCARCGFLMERRRRAPASPTSARLGWQGSTQNFTCAFPSPGREKLESAQKQRLAVGAMLETL